MLFLNMGDRRQWGSRGDTERNETGRAMGPDGFPVEV